MQRSVRKASPASRRAAMRRRRHLRIRRKVAGTTERPRLAVYRSLKHVVAQIIDDSRGVTLVGVSSSEPALAAVIPPATSPGATPTPPAAPEAAGAQAAAEAGAGPEKQGGSEAGAGPEKQGASEAGARSEKKTAGGGARDAGAKAKGDKKKTAAGGKDEEPKPSKKDRPTAARPEGAKTARARAAGRTLAERALAKGIRRVVFDRGGYVFHGRVRAFAEGARAGGLEF